MPPNQADDDAKLARMLQELENEEARYASQRNMSPAVIPSAPVYDYPNDTPVTSPLSSNGSMELSDEAYARGVQAQLQRSSAARGSSSMRVVSNDVDFARKVEQEMRDEQVARRLEQEEQEAANAQAAAASQQQQQQRRGGGAPRNRRTWTLGRMCIFVIPVAIAVGTALVLFMVFSGSTPDIPFLGPKEDDGFNGMEQGDIHQWKQKDGLELTLLNALDATWQEPYEHAFDDWETGVPDVLTLKSKNVPYEKACVPEKNVMKVCNGEYGDTGWRGVNSLTIQNGWITRSVAKLNDSYLKKAPYADRVYTACHEIGHGWGLPHTDEDFNNKDLGNCMDYTNTPENNMQPDLSNFLLLAELYGTADGVEYEGGAEQPPDADKPGDDDDRRRHLRRQRDLGDYDACGTPQAMARYDEIMQAFDQGAPQESDGCKRVKNSKFGSLWKISLATDCDMEVNLLRALP